MVYIRKHKHVPFVHSLHGEVLRILCISKTLIERKPIETILERAYCCSVVIVVPIQRKLSVLSYIFFRNLNLVPDSQTSQNL